MPESRKRKKKPPPPMTFRGEGYAVFDSLTREIFLNTVHATKQQAMVNGLVVIKGFITPQNWEYPAVRSKWLIETTGTPFTIVAVSVETGGVELPL